MATLQGKAEKKATAGRVARIQREADERHPGAAVQISWYGGEVFVDVREEGKAGTVARYRDVVSDLEAELTRPDQAGRR